MSGLGLNEAHRAAVPFLVVEVQGLQQAKELHAEVPAVLRIVFLRQVTQPVEMKKTGMFQ